MKQTLIVCSHNRPISPPTIESLGACIDAGATFVEQTGTTDVSLARNLALTLACERAAHRACDVVLMVDDDMVFNLDDAERVVRYARTSGFPASAMYATTLGALAACRLQTPPEQTQRWAAGLGFLAIPLRDLEALALSSERFEFMGQPQIGFTWSHAAGGVFWSEDFTLCRRLGGVHLLPIAVGHVKPIAIYPDDESIRRIRDGEPLGAELDPNVLRNIDTIAAGLLPHQAPPAVKECTCTNVENQQRLEAAQMAALRKGNSAISHLRGCPLAAEGV